MAENETQPANTGRRRLDLGVNAVKPEPAVAKVDETEPEAEIGDGEEVVVDVYAQPAPGGPVKLKAPENSAPVTLEDVEYALDADGFVEVPRKHVATLRAHGFEPTE